MYWLKALPTGTLLALITLLLSWWIFASDSQMPWRSLFAAVLTSALVWCSYIILYWFFSAIKAKRR